MPPQLENVTFQYVPNSVANMWMLLVYDDREQFQPFLGFIAHTGSGVRNEKQEFILYRGAEKVSKLRFLDRIWQDLAHNAVPEKTMVDLRARAKNLASQMEDGIKDDFGDLILNGLVVRGIDGAAGLGNSQNIGQECRPKEADAQQTRG